MEVCMTEAGFNLVYFEHQAACERSTSTAAELPVCILLISWKGLCLCQDTMLWWVPRSVLRWLGSGLSVVWHCRVLLTDKQHHKARRWNRSHCGTAHELLWRLKPPAVNFSFFKHKRCSFIWLQSTEVIPQGLGEVGLGSPVWHVCDMRAKGVRRDFAWSKNL